MTKRNNISYARKREIEDFLVTVIEKLEHGFCVYRGDESDASVARRFNCTPYNVMGIRTEMFGKLRERRKPPLEERIVAIENFLDEFDSSWRQRKLKLVSGG